MLIDLGDLRQLHLAVKSYFPTTQDKKGLLCSQSEFLTGLQRAWRTGCVTDSAVGDAQAGLASMTCSFQALG